jgi:hypothetical protein
MEMENNKDEIPNPKELSKPILIRKSPTSCEEIDIKQR